MKFNEFFQQYGIPAIFAIVIFQFGLSIFNSTGSIKTLNALKDELQMTRTQLGEAKAITAKLEKQLNDYQVFLADIQAGVELLELEREKNDARFRHQSDSINAMIERAHLRRDSIRNSLPNLNITW